MVNGMVVSCCVDGIYDDLRWPIYPTSEFKRLEVKVGKVSPYIFCHHSRPSITPSDHQPLPGTLKDPSIAWSRIEICFNPSFQEVKPASRISRCPMFSADGHRTYRTNPWTWTPHHWWPENLGCWVAQNRSSFASHVWQTIPQKKEAKS